jgi:hypothetical protein
MLPVVLRRDRKSRDTGLLPREGLLSHELLYHFLNVIELLICEIGVLWPDEPHGVVGEARNEMYMEMGNGLRGCFTVGLDDIEPVGMDCFSENITQQKCGWSSLGKWCICLSIKQAA